MYWSKSKLYNDIDPFRLSYSDDGFDSDLTSPRAGRCPKGAAESWVYGRGLRYPIRRPWSAMKFEGKPGGSELFYRIYGINIGCQTRLEHYVIPLPWYLPLLWVHNWCIPVHVLRLRRSPQFKHVCPTFDRGIDNPKWKYTMHGRTSVLYSFIITR